MHSPDGEADPRLAQALAAYAPDPTPAARAELLAAFVDAQVLTGLTAVATGHETAAATGLPAESGAELSLLLLETADGARALPVFTDLGALRRWRLDARPVPLTGAQACAAASDEGARHVLVDPQGAAVALEPAEVAALAAGRVPVPGSNLSARRITHATLTTPERPDPHLVRALRTALACERLLAARLLSGPDGLALGVAARQPLAAHELAALAQRVVRALGPVLPADGLDLIQVPSKGPGLSVLSRRRWRRQA